MTRSMPPAAMRSAAKSRCSMRCCGGRRSHPPCLKISSPPCANRPTISERLEKWWTAYLPVKANERERGFCTTSRRRTPFPSAGLTRYDGLSGGLGQTMKAGGGPTRSRSGATTTAKRRQAAKTARAPSPTKTKVESPAQTEIEQLVLELQEARERQAATAEVLSLISDSPTGIQQ